MISASQPKRNFYDLTLPDIRAWCDLHDLESYRAEQIFAWQKKGLTEFAQFSNLSKEIRSRLSADFEPIPLEIKAKIKSKLDDTVKYLLSLRDGNMIEAVLMQYRYGNAVCISSQVGCRMQCKFCASGGLGLVRNLTAGEMLAQVALINRLCGNKVSHVTIMGIGEPFDNYHNLVEFLKRLRDPQGLQISLRRVTVSTCGIIDKMIKFIDENLPITLSVSLHAPNQSLRKNLMPTAEKYPFTKLIDAGERYARQSGRRITYEYALFAGINDSKDQALELAAALQGKLCHVNLIAANAVPGLDYRPTSRAGRMSFKQVLEENKIKATLRRELGTDIAAACGQLRRSHENAGKSALCSYEPQGS
jgi:23S rRNA (adenine2503-C2)-methyltransferase